MTTREHAIRITIPSTAWQSTVLEAMRRDQLLLLRQNRERVPAPLWHEEPRADGLYMVFQFGSTYTATVFEMTWGGDASRVPPEQLDA
jgi:hypothetical protein